MNKLLPNLSKNENDALFIKDYAQLILQDKAKVRQRACTKLKWQQITYLPLSLSPYTVRSA